MIRGSVKKWTNHALITITLLLSLVFAVPVQAFTPNTIDTGVDSFSADYFISKDEEGTIVAEVKEKIALTFPNYDRNFGFDRELPFLLNDGKTQVMELSRDNFKVTRNDSEEPFEILQRKDNLVLKIGQKGEYLHDSQNYIIEYKIYNFAVNPTVEYKNRAEDTEENLVAETSPAYQEIFWSIFRNEWATSVQNIDVNFHFDNNLKDAISISNEHSEEASFTNRNSIYPTNETNLSVWCFIGNDANSQSRCKIEEIEDGFKLHVDSVDYSENLQVLTNFNPLIFKVSKTPYLGDEIYIADLKSDFTLSETENKSSLLKVSQTFSAVFPENAKKHELTWNLPISTAGNTRDFLDRDSIKTRLDGEDFSPRRIEYASGTLSLVFDIPVSENLRHDYEISYELHDVTNVVREYRPELSIFKDDSDSSNIELFINLISNGWHYNVENLIANFALDENLRSKLTDLAELNLGSPYCYVSASQEEALTCNIEETETGFVLSAEHIKKTNDLILFADFDAGTFAEVEPDKSYLHVILVTFSVLFMIISVLINLSLDRHKKSKAVFISIYTIVSLILIALLFAAPAEVYKLFGTSIYSEHIASFLRYPCAILLILVSVFITFKKLTKKPTDPTTPNKKPKTVTIVVATHKRYRMPKDSCYLPLRVGAKKLDKTTGEIVKKDSFGFKTDATGKNISTKNDTFCELTGLYWAWKNLDTDYIGLMHYRRFLTMNNKRLKTRNERFESVLSTEEINQLVNVERYDIILPKVRNYYIENLHSHYIHTSFRKPLDMTREIIAEKYPEYLPEFDHLKTRSSAHMFNIFIMRKDILDDYCEWLFDILLKLEKQVKADKTISYGAFHSRFYGRISELLLDVYFYTKYPNFGTNPKVKELRVINMEYVKWTKKGKAFLLAKFARRKYESSF